MRSIRPAFLLLLLATAPVLRAQTPTPALAPAEGAAPGSCGLLSTNGPWPEGLDIRPAFLARINEDSVRMRREEYRVMPGKHVVVVAEMIPSQHLTTSQQRQIVRMKQRRSYSGFYKPLVIDVREDRLYRIGVQLRRDRLDAASIADNAYWHPVVWEEVPRPCP